MDWSRSHWTIANGTIPARIVTVMIRYESADWILDNTDLNISPRQSEIPDGIDNDCDDEIDEWDRR